MRAIWLDVPQAFLDERARLGHDRRDELWEGELHLVPPPAFAHDLVATDLLFALKPIADRRSLRLFPSSPGMFAAPDDYRIPDVTMARNDQLTERGFASAELVVEVLSPHDESRKKLGFYARRGVRELWLLEPKSRAIEIHHLADARYELIAPVAGVHHSSLGITLEVIDGPKLRLHDNDYVVDV